MKLFILHIYLFIDVYVEVSHAMFQCDLCPLEIPFVKIIYL